MSTGSEIKTAIRRIAGDASEVYSLICKVVAVDSSERTCDVEPINGSAPVYRVKLQANINLQLGYVIIPALESHVIVTWLNKETAYVALTGTIDRIIITVQQNELVFDHTGMNVKIDQLAEMLVDMNGLRVKVDQSEMRLQKDGLALTNNTASLRNEMLTLLQNLKSLLGVLQNFTLITTGNPGNTIGVAPSSLGSLVQLESNIDVIRNNMNTLLAP